MSLKDTLELLLAYQQAEEFLAKNKNKQFRQKDKHGNIIYLDGYWGKGRQNELIDENGVGHYYNGWPHGCNGSCRREDFILASEIDQIDSNLAHFIKKYEMDSNFEEVKLEV